MTGGSMVGLVLLSMAWLFFAAGAVMNFSLLLKARRAQDGRQVAAGIPVLPGVVGSVAVFFTVPALGRYGIEVPWPWLWVLLPLVLEVAILFSRFKPHEPG